MNNTILFQVIYSGPTPDLLYLYFWVREPEIIIKSFPQGLSFIFANILESKSVLSRVYHLILQSILFAIQFSVLFSVFEEKYKYSKSGVGPE